MYDAVRWTLLILLFLSLLGVWLWSLHRAGKLPLVSTSTPPESLKIIQRSWIDQRTGVCLIQAEGQRYLLAYTVGGGVSWQPVPQAIEPPPLKTS